ncbi:unnamed protein product [Effrenium voratum]|nr:unnamed protein product [Effrenium voratum]
MTVISLEELSKHTAPNDTWMAIHGLVYDTSGFMTEHPGGAQLLESVAGQDASAEFEDALHSTAARTEEKISCKGVLAGSEKQVQRFREAGWDESMGVPDPEALRHTCHHLSKIPLHLLYNVFFPPTSSAGFDRKEWNEPTFYCNFPLGRLVAGSA